MRPVQKKDGPAGPARVLVFAGLAHVQADPTCGPGDAVHVGIVRLLSEYTVRIEETARVSIALSRHMGHIDTIGWFDSPRGPRGPRGSAASDAVGNAKAIAATIGDELGHPDPCSKSEMQQELDAGQAPSSM